MINCAQDGASLTTEKETLEKNTYLLQVPADRIWVELVFLQV